MGTRINTPEWEAKRAQLVQSDIAPLKALPTDFNSTTNWPQCASIIGHIRDQSDCGCCWAFGSTESFNDRLCIVHNVTVQVSQEETCACVGGGKLIFVDERYTPLFPRRWLFIYIRREKHSVDFPLAIILIPLFLFVDLLLIHFSLCR